MNDGCDQYCEIEQAWWCNRGLPPEVPYVNLGEDRVDNCFVLCGDSEVAVGQEDCDDGTLVATRGIYATIPALANNLDDGCNNCVVTADF